MKIIHFNFLLDKKIYVQFKKYIVSNILEKNKINYLQFIKLHCFLENKNMKNHNKIHEETDPPALISKSHKPSYFFL